MTQIYGNDLRKRVIEAIENGMSCHGAAHHFSIAPSTAIVWMQRYKKTGSFQSLKMGGHRPLKLAGYEDSMASLIQDCPDITCREIRLFLLIQNIIVSENTISRFLKRLGISFKKNTSRNGTGSPRCS